MTDLSLCVIVRRLLALHREATQETADTTHLTLTQFASIMEAVRGVHDGGDAQVGATALPHQMALNIKH